jgi:hypothetical protein
MITDILFKYPGLRAIFLGADSDRLNVRHYFKALYRRHIFNY